MYIIMGIANVTTENFESTVSASNFALLDFWAEWCDPCKTMEPVVEKLAAKYGYEVVFGRVNVDQEMEISSKFEILSIPTFVLFRKGQPMDVSIGAVGEASLERMVTRALNGHKS